MTDWQSIPAGPAELAYFEAARQIVVRIEREPVYGDPPWPELESRWADGESIESLGLVELQAGWVDLMRSMTARGVVVERVRIPHDPPTRCERFQRATEPIAVEAGERYRYADRAEANRVADLGLGLGLGLGDWWLFDDTALMAMRFDTAGRWLRSDVTTDLEVIRSAWSAWSAVRAISTDSPAWERRGAVDAA